MLVVLFVYYTKAKGCLYHLYYLAIIISAPSGILCLDLRVEICNIRICMLSDDYFLMMPWWYCRLILYLSGWINNQWYKVGLCIKGVCMFNLPCVRHKHTPFYIVPVVVKIVNKYSMHFPLHFRCR